MTDTKTQKWKPQTKSRLSEANIPTKSGVKFVGDTNFWISATFWRGLCYRIKQLLVNGKLAHVTSLKLLSEFAKVLRRDFNLSDDQAYIRYNEVMELSEVVYPQFFVLEQITVSRNYADNPVLECAVWGGAQYLVTRDKDLLIIDIYENVKITTRGSEVNHEKNHLDSIYHNFFNLDCK